MPLGQGLPYGRGVCHAASRFKALESRVEALENNAGTGSGLQERVEALEEFNMELAETVHEAENLEDLLALLQRNIPKAQKFLSDYLDTLVYPSCTQGVHYARGPLHKLVEHDEQGVGYTIGGRDCSWAVFPKNVLDPSADFILMLGTRKEYYKNVDHLFANNYIYKERYWVEGAQDFILFEQGSPPPDYRFNCSISRGVALAIYIGPDGENRTVSAELEGRAVIFYMNPRDCGMIVFKPFGEKLVYSCGVPGFSPLFPEQDEPDYYVHVVTSPIFIGPDGTGREKLYWFGDSLPFALSEYHQLFFYLGLARTVSKVARYVKSNYSPHAMKAVKNEFANTVLGTLLANSALLYVDETISAPEQPLAGPIVHGFVQLNTPTVDYIKDHSHELATGWRNDVNKFECIRSVNLHGGYTPANEWNIHSQNDVYLKYRLRYLAPSYAVGDYADDGFLHNEQLLADYNPGYESKRRERDSFPEWYPLELWEVGVPGNKAFSFKPFCAALVFEAEIQFEGIANAGAEVSIAASGQYNNGQTTFNNSFPVSLTEDTGTYVGSVSAVIDTVWLEEYAPDGKDAWLSGMFLRAKVDTFHNGTAMEYIGNQDHSYWAQHQAGHWPSVSTTLATLQWRDFANGFGDWVPDFTGYETHTQGLHDRIFIRWESGAVVSEPQTVVPSCKAVVSLRRAKAKLGLPVDEDYSEELQYKLLAGAYVGLGKEAIVLDSEAKRIETVERLTIPSILGAFSGAVLTFSQFLDPGLRLQMALVTGTAFEIADELVRYKEVSAYSEGIALILGLITARRRKGGKIKDREDVIETVKTKYHLRDNPVDSHVRTFMKRKKGPTTDNLPYPLTAHSMSDNSVSIVARGIIPGVPPRSAVHPALQRATQDNAFNDLWPEHHSVTITQGMTTQEGTDAYVYMNLGVSDGIQRMDGKSSCAGMILPYTPSEPGMSVLFHKGGPEMIPLTVQELGGSDDQRTREMKAHLLMQGRPPQDVIYKDFDTLWEMYVRPNVAKIAGRNVGVVRQAKRPMSHEAIKTIAESFVEAARWGNPRKYALLEANCKGLANDIYSFLETGQDNITSRQLLSRFVDADFSDTKLTNAKLLKFMDDMHQSIIDSASPWDSGGNVVSQQTYMNKYHNEQLVEYGFYIGESTFYGGGPEFGY